MPIFDYECPNCGNIVRDIIIMNNGVEIDERMKDGKVICNLCSCECKKMVSTNTTFRLEGDGWTPKFGR